MKLRPSPGAVLGFGLGLAAGGLAAALVGKLVLDDRLAHERRMGEIDGRQAALRAVESGFGPLATETVQETLFSLKAADVVAVEVDGVRTVRVRR